MPFRWVCGEACLPVLPAQGSLCYAAKCGSPVLSSVAWWSLICGVDPAHWLETEKQMWKFPLLSPCPWRAEHRAPRPSLCGVNAVPWSSCLAERQRPSPEAPCPVLGPSHTTMGDTWLRAAGLLQSGSSHRVGDSSLLVPLFPKGRGRACARGSGEEGAETRERQAALTHQSPRSEPRVGEARSSRALPGAEDRAKRAQNTLALSAGTAI